MMCETCKDWDMAIIVAKVTMENLARCPSCQRLAWPPYPRPSDVEMIKYESKEKQE